MGSSASGLVYAAIVLMWAAVLIPMWVRRHDVSSENRSAERFGQAMRVLSRREGSGERREIVVPAAPGRGSAGSSAVRGAVGRQVGSSVVSSPVPRPVERPPSTSRRTEASRAAARAALARRRARTLLVLGGAAVLLGLLALVSVVPGWAPLPLAVLLVGFVVHLRVQARRAAQLRRGTRPTSQVAPARRPVPAGTTRTRPAEVSRALVVETKGDAVATTLADEADPAARPTPTGLAPGDPSWRPNPMPLPTYVTAPKAVRPIRVIDLTTPGAWTSGRLLEDDVPVVADALAEADADAQELDALLEHDVAADAAATEPGTHHRRAVGH